MACVVAFVPDLLFGSRVLAAVRDAGHDGKLVANAAALRDAVSQADAVIVDLTADPAERITALGDAVTVPVLAFYSHVEADVRARALSAGFALVVPRSRMAREGAMLVSRLVAPSSSAGDENATP